MRQFFFLEGRLLGTAQRGPMRLGFEGFGWPLSKLFYCTECGDVFAKCPIQRPDGSIASWHSQAACCRRCLPKAELLVPGSIWHHEVDFVAAFPDAVLRWEFERHLDHAERQFKK